MPLVSVIMPVYKTERYLDEAVESVLAQTLADWELILVDDGSPDRCGAMCDIWAQKDARITALHKQNGGLASARNAGLECASGKYVAFLDSDDMYLPEFLKTLTDAAEAESLDFVRCGCYRFFDDKASERSEQRGVELSLKGREEIVRGLLLPMVGAYRNSPALVPTVWNMLYRAGVIRMSGLRFMNEREYQSEDLLFNLPFLLAAGRGRCLPQPLCLYRCAPQSLTTSYNPRQPAALRRQNEWLLEFGEKNGLLTGEYSARAAARLLDQTSVVIKKAVRFLPAGEALAEIKKAAADDAVRAALGGCDTAALGFPLSLFCSLLRAKMSSALWALIALYVKFAPER